MPSRVILGGPGRGGLERGGPGRGVEGACALWPWLWRMRTVAALLERRHYEIRAHGTFELIQDVARLALPLPLSRLNAFSGWHDLDVIVIEQLNQVGFVPSADQSIGVWSPRLRLFLQLVKYTHNLPRHGTYTMQGTGLACSIRTRWT